MRIWSFTCKGVTSSASRCRRLVVSSLLALSVVFIITTALLTGLRPSALKLHKRRAIHWRSTRELTGHLPKGIERFYRQPSLHLHAHRTEAEWLVELGVNASLAPPPGLSPLHLADVWVTPSELLPRHHPLLGHVLAAMADVPVIKADAEANVTSPLRLVLTVQGGHTLLFTPQGYRQDVNTSHQERCDPAVNRHSAEIATFHLSRVLGFHRVPVTTARVLKLSRDVIAVASPRLHSLLKAHGKGHNCAWCLRLRNSSQDYLPGSVTLGLPARVGVRMRPHPWAIPCQPPYRWANTADHCGRVLRREPFGGRPLLLLDVVDAAVLNYLAGDSRYTLHMGSGAYRSLMLSLHHGKGFGSYEEKDDMPIILAPLLQCCVVRKSTYNRLLSLQKGILGNVMRRLLNSDPLQPLLHWRHFQALNRRLRDVIFYVTNCIQRHGKERVVLSP